MTPLRIGGPFRSRPCEDLWSTRLEKLQTIRDQHADGPVWLWNMRIRILTYLVSRYSHSAGDQFQIRSDRARDAKFTSPPIGMNFGSDEPSEWSLPIIRYSRSSDLGIERPPRSAESFSAALDKISDENDAVRSIAWRRPPCDTVWSWWRETYAARKPLADQ
jgi:hypothetical protein